mgnify:FL=1
MLVISTLHIAAIVAAYLIGSLSSAIILCKLAGLPDPRSEGSGNPGATNVLRIGGKKLAVMVLFIDVVKGVLPVAIVGMAGFNLTWVAATAFAVFLGHLYPVFFQFKGGKGVATALGGFLALSPSLGGAILLSWLVVFFISRISSLSAIIAASLAPLYSVWLINSLEARWIIFVMTTMLIIRHKSNIKRLLLGEESNLKQD